jgi:hypothetical protein
VGLHIRVKGTDYLARMGWNLRAGSVSRFAKSRSRVQDIRRND